MSQQDPVAPKVASGSSIPFVIIGCMFLVLFAMILRSPVEAERIASAVSMMFVLAGMGYLIQDARKLRPYDYRDVVAGGTIVIGPALLKTSSGVQLSYGLRSSGSGLTTVSFPLGDGGVQTYYASAELPKVGDTLYYQEATHRYAASLWFLGNDIGQFRTRAAFVQASALLGS